MSKQVDNENLFKALDGIKILDLSIQVPGPYCTMLLADMGAEVIKIEQPGMGDFARLLPFLFNGINRNKKSMVLDMKSPAAKEIFYKLSENSDVIIEGFRPGVTKRLGVDYESMKKINPKIIYCSITGYGQDGPYHNISGHDINYCGIAGLLGLEEDLKESAEQPGIPVGDIAGSMFAAISILTAIINRGKTGKGQYLDVSMTAGVFSWISGSIIAGLKANNSPSLFIPHYGIFKTSDDKFITLGIVHEEHFWNNLCSVIDLGELKNLKIINRIAKRKEVFIALNAAFLTKTRDEWIDILNKADVPCGPVLSINESLEHPQIRHRDLVHEIDHPVDGKIKQRGFPVKFADSKGQRFAPPPLLGQHTDEILTNLGYTAGDITKLKEEKVINK
jgi:crotonobetainyl-CoA:carnitine CoA-transferase CaiB-like acyl-CoA transferase